MFITNPIGKIFLKSSLLKINVLLLIVRYLTNFPNYALCATNICISK